jgi:hypothetical protein
MSMDVSEGREYRRFTATGNIALQSGQRGHLFGVFAALASNTPTLAVNDSNGNITANFSLSPGQFYPMPCTFTGQCNFTLSGTVDITVFWAPM